ncbi:MAG: aldehyde dehydrogenase [Mycetocola sp.]
MFTRNHFLIGGRGKRPHDDGRLELFSPYTEQTIGSAPRAVSADIDVAVSAARESFDEGQWSRMSVGDRVERLEPLAELLGERMNDLVELQVDEVGSPTGFVRAATQGTLRAIALKSEEARRIRWTELRDGTVGKVMVMRSPIGVVGVIIPWNSPVPMLLSRILPALLTGSSIVVKPAEESPLSAYLVADALERLDLPDGVVSIVPGGRQVGEHLVRHPGVDKVSFTGSTAAGARVGSLCGQLIRPVTLELGGKSAAILLEDIDIAKDLPAIVASAIPNNGQVCFATTRVLAPRSRYQEVTTALSDFVGSLKVGNPHDPDTAVGPVVSERQRMKIEELIRSGVETGARVVAGGGRPADQSRGWFVEPTVLADVDNSSRVAQEEIFGPVITVTPFDDEDHAVALANDSTYGLGGAVFSANTDHALDVASRVRSGTCSVNGAPGGGGGGPFGGHKLSGLGKEHGEEGWSSYLLLKSVALPAGYEPII